MLQYIFYVALTFSSHLLRYLTIALQNSLYQFFNWDSRSLDFTKCRIPKFDHFLRYFNKYQQLQINIKRMNLGCGCLIYDLWLSCMFAREWNAFMKFSWKKFIIAYLRNFLQLNVRCLIDLGMNGSRNVDVLTNLRFSL